MPAVVELAADLTEAVDRNLTVHGVLHRPDRRLLQRLSVAVDAGLRPRVVDRLPLEESPQAHRRLEAGGLGGKLVLMTSQ